MKFWGWLPDGELRINEERGTRDTEYRQMVYCVKNQEENWCTTSREMRVKEGHFFGEIDDTIACYKEEKGRNFKN